MSTRIGIMEAGRILQVGTPGEIYEFPANRFVAGFVGAINQFPGRVATRPDGSRAVQAEGLDGGLVVRLPHAVAPGSPIVVAVRPEKIRLGIDAPPPGDNCLEGTVEDIAYLGDVSIYHLRVAPHLRVEAQLTNRTRRAAPRLTWGDRAWLSWDADDALALLD